MTIPGKPRQEVEVSYELHNAQTLTSEQLNLIADQIAQSMSDDKELTSYPQEAVRTWLEKEKAIIALNENGEYLGGVILYNATGKHDSISTYSMMGLNVNQQYRGQGIGKRLFDTALNTPGNIIIESTNPIIHQWCKQQSCMELSTIEKYTDPLHKLIQKRWNQSYLTIALEMIGKKGGLKTFREVLVGMFTTQEKYKAFCRLAIEQQQEI